MMEEVSLARQTSSFFDKKIEKNFRKMMEFVENKFIIYPK